MNNIKLYSGKHFSKKREFNFSNTNFNKLVLVFFILLTLSFFAPACFAIITKASMPVFAVVSGEDKAIQATLTIEIEPGKGDIFTKIGPLVGTSTQNTEKISVELAKNYFNKVNEYDYKFTIESDASIVDGPSAGAAMALLLTSMLQDKEIPKNVAVTGTINTDGSVGQVGGVFVKAKSASEQGIALFLIPSGEALQTHKFQDNSIKTVDLTQYGWSEWNIKIIEVETLDDLLKYALMSPENIDIEEIAKKKPPMFVPEAIPLNSKLEVMKEFTKQYLEEASTKINSAKGSLANTILNDSAIESTLYESIAQAEQTLDEAKALFEQNYLYSAANYSFLTIVNAAIVEDISSNPSLLQMNSVLFTQIVTDLEKDALKLREQLDSIVPVETIEWDIAAKERLAWAIAKISKIKQSQGMTIEGIGGVAIAVENLREYEFAKAWIDIAKTFHEFSSQSKKYVDTDATAGLFEKIAQENIVKAENELTALSIEDVEDISRRLQAAYIEKDEEWYLAAAVDAASAYWLAKAAKESQGKNLQELLALVQEKIDYLNKKIAESEKEFVWSQMYLDHASYFFKSAKFYQDHNSMVKAKQDAESAVSLTMFAEGIFEVMNYAYNEIAKLPTTDGKKAAKGTGTGKTSEENGTGTGSGMQTGTLPAAMQLSTLNINTLLFAILIMLIIIFLLLLAYFFRTSSVSVELSREANAEEKIKQIHKIREQVDKALVEGKISERKHDELSKKYEEKLNEVAQEEEKESKDLLELDRFETELAAQRFLLRKIERQYKTKKIKKSSFDGAKKQIETEIISLNEHIKNAKIALARDEKEIEEIKIEKPEMKTEEEQEEKEKEHKEEKEISKIRKNRKRIK